MHVTDLDDDQFIPKLALQEPADGGGAHSGAALPACVLVANSQRDITFENRINALCNTILMWNNFSGELADNTSAIAPVLYRRFSCSRGATT